MKHMKATNNKAHSTSGNIMKMGLMEIVKAFQRFQLWFKNSGV